MGRVGVPAPKYSTELYFLRDNVRYMFLFGEALPPIFHFFSKTQKILKDDFGSIIQDNLP